MVPLIDDVVLFTEISAIFRSAHHVVIDLIQQFLRDLLDDFRLAGLEESVISPRMICLDPRHLFEMTSDRVSLGSPGIAMTKWVAFMNDVIEITPVLEKLPRLLIGFSQQGLDASTMMFDERLALLGDHHGCRHGTLSYFMLLEYLFETNPYEGFPAGDLPLDHAGFNLPIESLSRIVELRPRRVIEVGTWKGNSAFLMADLLRAARVDFEMVCIDTWLGSSEMWLKPYRDDVPERRLGMRLDHGYPTIYRQFLANVIHKGFTEQIVPIPNTSSIAHKILKTVEYSAGFIYIDGNHDAFDVSQDIKNYWELLEPGGILCGDDYFWDGVRTSVDEHARSTGVSLEIHEEENSWSFRKPS